MKEWNSAVKLHQRGICRVVVCQFGVVSRPEPLKRFLYLDFKDDTKRDAVMNMLVSEIGM